MEITLAAGQRPLGLGGATDLIVEVPEEGRCVLSFDAPEVDDWAGGEEQTPQLERAEMTFSPPLRLDNLLAAGAELPLGSGLPRRLQGLIPLPIAALLKQGVLTADGALAFALEGLRVARADGRLKLSVSGTLHLLGQKLPLRDVQMPLAIASAGSASLSWIVEWLQSLSPRAIDQLVAFVAAFEANVSASLLPPRLVARTSTADGTRYQLALDAAPMSVHLSASGVISERDLTLDIAPLRLLCGTARESAVRARLEARLSGGELVDATASLDAAEGLALPEMVLSLRSEHPLCQGGTVLSARLAPALQPTTLGARAAQGIDSLVLDGAPELTAKLDDAALAITYADGEITIETDGEVGARFDSDSGEAHLTLRGALRQRMALPVAPVAELEINVDRVRGTARGEVDLAIKAARSRGQRALPALSLAGSRLSFSLADGQLELDRRVLSLPRGLRIDAALERGGLHVQGIDPLAIDVDWDLGDGQCDVRFGERVIDLLARVTRHGSLRVTLDENGGIAFSGEGEAALERVRALNALLDPAGEPAALIELLGADHTIDQALAVLRLFSDDLAERLQTLRAIVAAARHIMRGERIDKPRDMVPRPAIARVLSLLLVGNGELAPELEPMVKSVTEGRGLPLADVKQLLARHLGELDLDFELAAIVAWLEVLLGPGPVGEAQPAWSEEEPPLCLDARYADERVGLPDARSIEAIGEAPDADGVRQLAKIARELSQAQLSHLTKRLDEHLQRGDGAALPADALRRLRYVSAVKSRVARMRSDYGAASHAAQALAISQLIGQAVGPLPGANCEHSAPGSSALPACALGAEDIAILLQATLASGNGLARQAQINSRLLLELCARSEPQLLRGVLVELGQHSARTLAGILFALLGQDQDQLRAPMDIPGMFGEKLGLEVPRHAEHMAGGRRARDSYFGALSALAERIIAAGDGYLSRKQHLQVVRNPSAPVRPRPPSSAPDNARHAIARADANPSAAAYEEAFAACRQLLRADPLALREDWLRAFWARNEEALRVRSVALAYRQGTDRVRRWMRIQLLRSGIEAPAPEADDAALAQAAMRALYYRAEDKQALLDDPLVSLMLPPPEGPYDFSLVSAMGVITEGAAGHELEDAYRRLEQRLGVTVYRAPTATARSLEYNAARIIETAARSTTPWGYVGYSQGCANALFAESWLHGSPPPRRRLLEGLVARNLLFSAANGSAHGSAGIWKYAQLMIRGERVLKRYQGLFSREAIDAFLRVIKITLDSQLFVHLLGGTHSLSYERARLLHRDGQFLPHVPTSTTRAVVTEDRLPESLELFYYIQRALSGGAEQDTQVLLTDAVGRSTRVENDATRALARCEIPSLPQATHHWAPLTREIRIVETERDVREAIYDSPKDQLIFPWIEANARFGRITRR
ncbi:MAG: hypothetical protein KC503_34755 [Myxococcales bacterium]|nr:hypothetical protein [Myxococcales bacterium]